MSQHIVPFLIVNISCEVIFIINERLHDQGIEKRRIDLIMYDITSKMFDKGFIRPLFTLQAICEKAAIYKVCLLLNECSTISLNENSIQKLHDIVLMTVKYQLLTLDHPLELVEMTLNHLNEAKQLIPHAAEKHVMFVESLFESLCRHLCVGQLAEIRQCLLNFSLDQRIQISLFLENGIQIPGGSFRIPKSRFIAPVVNTEAPGLMRSFTKQEHSLVSQQHFYHPGVVLTLPPHIKVGQWVPSQLTARMTKNGLNMFSRQQRDLLSVQCGGVGRPPTLASAQPRSSTDDVVLQAYTNEVNTLATMLRGARGDAVTEAAPGRFKLGIFDDDSGEESEADEQQPRPKAPQGRTTTSYIRDNVQLPAPHVASGSAEGAPAVVRRENPELLDIIGSLKDDKPPAKSDPVTRRGAVNDLLDIMDDEI